MKNTEPVNIKNVSNTDQVRGTVDTTAMLFILSDQMMVLLT